MDKNRYNYKKYPLISMRENDVYIRNDKDKIEK